MQETFRTAIAFNQDLSKWDVSSVTNFLSTFRSMAMFNQPLNSWDVSSVEDMAYLFDDTDAFNQDISSWDMSSVTDVGDMFNKAMLSADNYVALLNNIVADELPDGLDFHRGCSETSEASDAIEEILVNDKSWLIEYNTEEECVELFPTE